MANTKDLRSAGLKSTAPRLKILELFESSGYKHMTADEVYKRLIDRGEDMGLATVYRVLTQFEAAGLLTKHNFEGNRAIFELKEQSHHDHMVCVECGKVLEFIDKTIEKRQKKVCEQAGFIMQDHAMYLYGVCEGVANGKKCSMK